MLRAAVHGRALFASTLETQKESFARLGYVVIRSPLGKSHQISLASLKTTIATFFTETRVTWSYRFWRFFHSVNTADHRHAIPLPSHLEGLQATLFKAIHHVKPFLDTQLNKNSSLVEMNAFISLPGSAQQKVHCDIAFEHAKRYIITGFIALEDVNKQDGPTVVFGETHTQHFHQHMEDVGAIDKELRFYNADGSEDHDSQGKNQQQQQQQYRCAETGALAVSPEAAAQSAIGGRAPLEVHLLAGDMLVFDTRLFHYGSANTSDKPRMLLSFSMQQSQSEVQSQSESQSESGDGGGGVDGGAVDTDRIRGFTYHLHESISRQRLTLDSFR
jgi:ectoine hydroxylase-related dioxygenase (phytanoyl-CoA dioxygenase family)